MRKKKRFTYYVIEDNGKGRYCLKVKILDEKGNFTDNFKKMIYKLGEYEDFEEQEEKIEDEIISTRKFCSKCGFVKEFRGVDQKYYNSPLCFDCYMESLREEIENLKFSQNKVAIEKLEVIKEKFYDADFYRKVLLPMIAELKRERK